MNRDEFSVLLRDALVNIHDFAVLEKHPLGDILPSSAPSVSKAEKVRSFIWEGIKTLKPVGDNGPADSLEWRYYRILSGRYIEGLTIADLQKHLSLGERQERRMHNRAANALEELLWHRLFSSQGVMDPQRESSHPVPDRDTPVKSAIKDADVDFSFPVTLESLHLDRVIDETAALFLPRLHERGRELSIQVPADLPMIQADRIILRQILLHLFNQVPQNWVGNGISINAYPAPDTGMIVLEILFSVKRPFILTDEDLFSNKLFAYWVERLNARVRVESSDQTTGHAITETCVQTAFILELPRANQAKVLVVDDHEPAIRIIQRYLSQTNIRAVGVSDPAQVLPIARSLHPRAVLLDVMMPSIDGWEILQKLKSDPGTHQIPVIICSVWDQPDLAYSLGADAFLKKPIIQDELLNELARLSLMDTSGELPPAGF